MKYFTSEWWVNGCKDESVFGKYQEYLASVETKLPEQLFAIQNKYTLHDSNVKLIESDFSQGKVTIALRGWDIEFKEKMKYVLEFSGVTRFIQVFPPQEYVESELGYLGYWEYEAKHDGTEMRMLFASGAEFIIEFIGFEFANEKIEA